MKQSNNFSPSVTSSPPSPVVRVIVPLWVPSLLDYAWHEGEPAQIGQLVTVAVGNKTVAALVVELPEKAAFKGKLKPAKPIVNAPVLPAKQVEFYRFVARYNLAAPGAAWRSALIAGKVPPEPALARRLIATDQVPPRMTAARAKVLQAASQANWVASELAQAAGVSVGVVAGLEKAGALKWQEVVPTEVNYQPEPIQLNTEQQAAVEQISQQSGKFNVTLLDGVTGSGKTEVYFELIAQQLAKRTGQILVLVPEIALTPQLIQRFTKHFGAPPAVWHSGLTPVQRAQTWWQVIKGQARVVVGARSALFLPWQQLDLVVVDEEHDASYKQDEQLRYHGRDMAITLGQQHGCPVVLGSATPSLESYAHAKTSKYQYVRLTQRFSGVALPNVQVVDLKVHKPLQRGHYLSPELIGAIDGTLKRGEQALLYLNRRGVAPLLVCRSCGHKHECPSCSAMLVVHPNKMQCHHCGYTAAKPAECVVCGSEDLAAFGPGTRKIAEEVEHYFPLAQIAVADSDAVGTAKQLQELSAKVAAKEIDIVIGTQLVTKGHDFPHLTLVGVLDADMGLGRGDFRAAERTFQTLTQVAGRAGRRKQRGQVVLQTHDPEHPLIQALAEHDRDRFYELELAERKRWQDPPFSKMIALTVQGKDQRKVQLAAQQLVQRASELGEGKVLGPAPAAIERVRNIYHWRLLLQAEQQQHRAVQELIQTTPIATGVEVMIDVDPQRLS